MPAPDLRHAALRRGLGRPARALERVIGGGRLRERALLAALRAHYTSRFRREWLWTHEPPHYFDHRLSAFELCFGDAAGGFYPWARAFAAADVIREGDLLLDIGCGNGYFTKHFLAPRCRAVDALDIDPDAVTSARRDDAAPNITYHLTDAAREPFPRDRYDVIVCDGAIGHLNRRDAEMLLVKIGAALTAGAVFCGSESLGLEGTDHLQYFESTDELRDLFARFPHVWLRELRYEVGDRARLEALWRCAPTPARHRATGWA